MNSAGSLSATGGGDDSSAPANRRASWRPFGLRWLVSDNWRRSEHLVKIRWVILIFSEVITGYLMLFAPVFHDRQDLARAISACRTSPSPEATAELTRQRQITRHQQRLIFGIFGLMFIGNSYALVGTWRRAFRACDPVV